MTRRITISLPLELYLEVRDAAARDRRSVSDWMRRLAERAVEDDRAREARRAMHEAHRNGTEIPDPA